MTAKGMQKLWPYPFWVAHRGAGKLAPENTMAAFKLGAQHGYRMFECDAKLSADGQVFLLHDTTLERATNASGLGSALSWPELAKLDAGSWHSSAFAGEPLCTLQTLSAWCRANGYLLNIEIKPTPGDEVRTGTLVAQEAARCWHGASVPPLLTSFQTASLAAAQAAQPDLPRGFLLNKPQPDGLEVATALGCVAIVCHHSLWNTQTVQAAKQAGFRTLSYTVNEVDEAKRLMALGTDGIITDRVDLFKPSAPAGSGVQLLRPT
jgi:glycerophosphoryl diester phosphodiesterase